MRWRALPAGLPLDRASLSSWLEQRVGGHGITASVNSCLIGTAHLGALSNNGGLTRTMLPLTGSSAVDTGSTADAAAAGMDITSDQRGTGFDRNVGSAPDIGATEQGLITSNG